MLLNLNMKLCCAALLFIFHELSTLKFLTSITKSHYYPAETQNKGEKELTQHPELLDNIETV
jgi:hypothetical protein